MANIQYSPLSIPNVEDEPSWQNKINALVNQNITGAKALQRNYTFSNIPEKDFSIHNDKSKEILNKYNVPAEDLDKYSKVGSITELENKIQYRNSIKKEAEIVSNMGATGVVGSLAVGMLDPVQALIGGVAGKVASKAINAYSLSSKGIKLVQAAAGGVGAIGSVAGLEYSLDGELTKEQALINGALGFGIGYLTSGKHIENKSILPAMENIKNTKGLETGANGKGKLDLMFEWMHSSADRLKTSDNTMVRDIGYKISRSMHNVGLQGEDTANDLMSKYTSNYLNKFKSSFEDFKSKFQSEKGREFTLDDEKIATKEIYEVDTEYSKLKDDLYNKEVNSIKEAEKAKVLDEYSQYLNSKDTDSLKAMNKKLKDIDSRKLTPEEDIKVRDTVSSKASSQIDNIISKKTPEYIPLIKEHQKLYQQYGQEIKDSNLNGYEKLDNTFYAQRSYDSDAIVNNKEGAIEAFKQALVHNFNDITPELDTALTEKATGIVDSIIKSTSEFSSMDIDSAILKKSSFAGLKGRTLKLDASKLMDFMNADIMHNATLYDRRVGGELALKNTVGIDKQAGNSVADIAKKIGANDKERKLLEDAESRVRGTSEFDPNADSKLAKVLRGFNQINYLNFGGYFGINTLTDLSNITNDFGINRTLKYATEDIVGALKTMDLNESRKFARIMGLASESLTGDRAILMGAESVGQGKSYLFEKQLNKMSGYMSKLSGMHMIVDFMDRVSSMASMDYILTKNIDDVKFVKNMNRLGLSIEDVVSIRNSGMADIGFDGISNVNMSKLSDDLQYKVERAIRRSVRDTVLRANEVDTPMFLNDLVGPTLGKALFQFMRFPVMAYNKLGIKMKENFDLVDATMATLVGSTILSLTNQVKDIGKAEPRYDLGTKEGNINNIVSIVERLPFLSVVSLPNNYVDIIGRLGNAAGGIDVNGNPSLNLGITYDRVQKLAQLGGDIANFNLTKKDALIADSFIPFGNLPYLQPFNNMFKDYINDKGGKEVVVESITLDDVKKYRQQEELAKSMSATPTKIETKGSSVLPPEVLGMKKEPMNTNTNVTTNKPVESVVAPKDYGTRPDGTAKGSGWLGEIKMANKKDVMTELSIGVNINGKETLIPTIVPTLTKSEVSFLAKGNEPTKAIMDKAVKFAQDRISQGLSPFKDANETISSMANTAKTTVSNAITSAKDTIATTATSIANKATKLVQPKVNKEPTKIDTTMSLANVVKANITGLTKVAVVGGIAQGIKEIGSMATKASNVIGKYVDEAISNMPELSMPKVNVQGKRDTAIKGIQSSIGSTADKVSSFISTTSKDISKVADDIYGNSVKTIDKKLSFINNEIKKVAIKTNSAFVDTGKMLTSVLETKEEKKLRTMFETATANKTNLDGATIASLINNVEGNVKIKNDFKGKLDNNSPTFYIDKDNAKMHIFDGNGTYVKSIVVGTGKSKANVIPKGSRDKPMNQWKQEDQATQSGSYTGVYKNTKEIYSAKTHPYLFTEYGDYMIQYETVEGRLSTTTAIHKNYANKPDRIAKIKSPTTADNRFTMGCVSVDNKDMIDMGKLFTKSKSVLVIVAPSK